MTNPAAGGQRCIASEGSYWMRDVGQMLKPEFPSRRIPSVELPNWVISLVALFDRDVREVREEIGIMKRVDGSRGPQRLGRPLITTAESAVATGQSLIAHKLV